MSRSYEPRSSKSPANLNYRKCFLFERNLSKSKNKDIHCYFFIFKEYLFELEILFFAVQIYWTLIKMSVWNVELCRVGSFTTWIITQTGIWSNRCNFSFLLMKWEQVTTIKFWHLPIEQFWAMAEIWRNNCFKCFLKV